jgi:hypothetical protein
VVIGVCVVSQEAKRIGEHLLSVVDAGTRPKVNCVLSHDHELVYAWQPDDGDEPCSEQTPF